MLAPATTRKGDEMHATNDEIAVVITSPNESLDRTVNLTDLEALKKLKKRVTNILNDAIEAAQKGADKPPAGE
jgi:hypothetical protein